MTLPLNQILQGNCIDVLNSLPEKSVDLIFADPPYNLQLQNDLYRPNLSKVDAVDDNWDKFSSFSKYDEFTSNWLRAAKRVLKDTGTIWVIGSYHNIYRVGVVMQDLGFWILNDVLWIKCLSGDTELFALINNYPILSTIKDLIRIDLNQNSIKLPSYNEHGCQTWVNLNGWKKSGIAKGYRIEFEDGYTVETTSEHIFPVIRSGKLNYLPVEKIIPDDYILRLGKIEIPEIIEETAVDKEFGEFIGWYLAEGSFLADDKGIQLSMSADEKPEAEKLINIIKRKFGIVGRIHVYNKSLSLVFPGRFMIELINRFIRGNNAKNKRLARESLWHGNDFLHGILIGYLNGDGHWDEKNKRWRIGFAKNKGLLTDLRFICHANGYRLHAKDAFVPYKDAKVEIIRGEIRKNLDNNWNNVTLESLGLASRGRFSLTQAHSIKRLKTDYKINTRKSHGEITEIAKQIINGDMQLTKVTSIQTTNLKTYYDLSVDGNHLFALPSGILTHNSNPMPNFRGVRFTNAHETLLWAQKEQGAKYTFNHKAMKALNDDLQMRSDWVIPLATGKERLKTNGTKTHPTQKPEALLYRVILSTTNPGDVVLDPFFGSGTTGAVAKKLGRNFIGIERETKYIKAAQKRIDAIKSAPAEALELPEKRNQERVPFGALVENGYLKPGQKLQYAKGKREATILANGHIKCGKLIGSIHAVARELTNAPANGWEMWLYTERGKLKPINDLREKYRKAINRKAR